MNSWNSIDGEDGLINEQGDGRHWDKGGLQVVDEQESVKYQ